MKFHRFCSYEFLQFTLYLQSFEARELCFYSSYHTPIYKRQYQNFETSLSIFPMFDNLNFTFLFWLRTMHKENLEAKILNFETDVCRGRHAALSKRTEPSTQQTFFRWPDTNLVQINRINVSRSFTIFSTQFKISLVTTNLNMAKFYPMAKNLSG